MIDTVLADREWKSPITTTFRLGLSGAVAARAASGLGIRIAAKKASISKLPRRQYHDAPGTNVSRKLCPFSWECERFPLVTRLTSFCDGSPSLLGPARHPGGHQLAADAAHEGIPAPKEGFSTYSAYL
jgi:hypothetical protein